jgi:hypothetical protein
VTCPNRTGSRETAICTCVVAELCGSEWVYHDGENRPGKESMMYGSEKTDLLKRAEAQEQHAISPHGGPPHGVRAQDIYRVEIIQDNAPPMVAPIGCW